MCGLGAVPSILLAVFLLWCPGSPRQLIAFEKHQQCAVVLRKIYPNATELQVQDKISLLRNEVNRVKAMHSGMT